MRMNLGRLKARLNPPDLYEGIIRPLRRGDKINATYVSGIMSRDLVAHVYPDHALLTKPEYMFTLQRI